MNSVRRPSYAFASTSTITGCGSPCTDGDAGGCVYKGILSFQGCADAQAQFNSGVKKNPAKASNQKQGPAIPLKNHGVSQARKQQIQNIKSAPSISGTDSNPIPDTSGSGSVLPAPSSIISDIQAKAKDIAASTGVPIPILTALGVGTLIFLLIMIVK